MYDVIVLGNILRQPRIGARIKRCIEEMPFISLETSIQPITRTILRIQLTITPEFRWNNHVGTIVSATTSLNNKHTFTTIFPKTVVHNIHTFAQNFL